MNNKRALIGMLCQIGASCIFGFSFIATKLGVGEADALTLLAWRFCISFAVFTLLILCRVLKVNLKGKPLKPLLVVAFFQPVLYFFAETYGIQLTTASESGTIIACIPIVTLILASRLLKEKPTRLQITGIVISVLGVIVIALVKGFSASLNPWGYALLLCAILCDGMYVVSVRRAASYTSAEITYIMMGAGALVFTLAAVVRHGISGTLAQLVSAPFASTGFLVGVLYLALLSSVCAFMLSNKGIELLGATRASSFAGLTTVISVLGGVLILKESFSLLQGVGTLMVLFGVYAVNRLPKNAVSVETKDISGLEAPTGEQEHEDRD